ncbi:hypothetical protein PR048_030469 [Dryococelus australis]|uniref:Uncharacterized protein n=1 Tax=Dryococelus australis TaxID=614101 RepID=A0ABQ9G931_9NEOP|nr:hypothetical protein PR048_030469 [Dryococelus australis]
MGTKHRNVSYPDEGYGKMCTLEEEPDMTQDEFKKSKEKFLSLQFDVNEIEDLQERTVLQSQSQLWKTKRANKEIDSIVVRESMQNAEKHIMQENCRRNVVFDIWWFCWNTVWY